MLKFCIVEFDDKRPDSNRHGILIKRNPISQWEFSRQKGMKIRFLAKAGLELETPEFPQQYVLTIEPLS